MGDAQVLCGYCTEPIEDDASLDEHLDECEKRPPWLPRTGSKREPKT